MRRKEVVEDIRIRGESIDVIKLAKKNSVQSLPKTHPVWVTLYLC